MNTIDEKTRSTAIFVSNVLFRACVLGFVLLGISSIAMLSLTEQMYAVHSSMIDIPRPSYNAMLFDWIANMKILVLVFFLLPAIAIRWTLKALQ
jgi:hypothetical protein